MYFDLNIKGTNFKNDMVLLNEAKRLGWDYLFLNYDESKYWDVLNDFKQLKDNQNFDLRLEISINNCNNIQKNINKYRDKINCISVLGGDLKINRYTCENIKIDILSRPYFKRKDCGINHVLAKEACNNNVAIELCFNDVLNSYLSHRAKTIMYFKDIIKLYKKFQFPLIISSGASSVYDIRNPTDISYFLNEIGLSNDEIIESLSKNPQNILNLNKIRENLIFKGVKKIEGFDYET